MPESDDLNAFEKKFTSQLYRFDCPSPFDLANYHSGLLPGEMAHKIETHLKTCPHCREELEDMEEFCSGDIPRTRPGIKTAGAVNKIIPLVRHKVYYETVEIKSALRGTTDAGAKKISIQYKENEKLGMFYHVVRQNDAYTVRAQFVVPESTEKLLTDSLVEIWQHNTIIATSHIDDLCAFRCTVPDPAPLIIRISNQDGTILSFQLVIS